MLYKILMLLSVFHINTAFAQTEYCIDDFSDTYFAKVIIDKSTNDEIIKRGNIIVFTKKNKKKIISVITEDFIIKHAIKKNSCMKYPYEKQKILIYQDFNFDGQKDFAIWDGNNACYGGKSYKIFLKNKTGFALNITFSNLTHAPFCDMFEIDRKNKQIETFSKSGCCEQTTTYYQILYDTIIKPVKKISLKFNPVDSIVKKKIFYFKKSK